jgi:hypothetical protein
VTARIDPRTITGRRYGSLVAMCRVRVDRSHGQIWAFLCDCGAERVARLQDVRGTPGRDVRAMCLLCAHRYGGAARTQGARNRRIARTWKHTHRLYTLREQYALEQQVLCDLEDEYGLTEEYTPPGFARGLYRLDDDEGTKGWIG